MELELNKSRFPEIDAPGEYGATLEQEGFASRVHEQSIGVPLTRILEQVKAQALPQSASTVSKELEGLYSRFMLWLVPHSFSLIRRSGRAEPTSVGMQIEYLNDSRTCSIVALMPSYREIVHGTFQATVSAAGDVAPLASLGSGSDSFSLGGLQLSAAAGAALSFAVKATVVTPYVSVVGANSDQAEWRFDKHEHALYGRDLSVWTVVALPKRQRTLKWKARFYAVVRRFVVSTRIESPWSEELECTLDG